MEEYISIEENVYYILYYIIQKRKDKIKYHILISSI